MADDKALRSWVSDQLFALVGFAEASLVSYVVALGTPPRARPPRPPLTPPAGKKASNAGALAAELTEQARRRRDGGGGGAP